MKLNPLDRMKHSFRRRILSRKLYDEDMVATLSESERIALRSKYLRQLGFFSTLLLVSLLTLLGVYLLGSPKEDFIKGTHFKVGTPNSTLLQKRLLK